MRDRPPNERSDNPTFNNVTTGASISPGTSNNNWGWTAGVGVEWAFSDNWSARLEYDYIGLNSQTMAVPTGSPFLGGDQITSNGRSLQMVSVGVNYKFWGY